MISKQAVEEQLKRIGCNFRFWGRSEVNELGRILMEDEIIAECVNGEYGNGFAMLVATNHRILLVDKKPLLYLTVEDYRYEMITEFNYNHRMLDATINIYTTNKTMHFTSWNQHRLRKLLEYAQARVLEMRHHQQVTSEFAAAAANQFAQAYAAQTQQQIQQVAIQPGQPGPTQEALPAHQHPQLTSHAMPDGSGPGPTPTSMLPPAPETPQQPAAPATESRWAQSRAALGTYTRSKLPRLRPSYPPSDPYPQPE